MTSSTGTTRIIALVDMDCFYVQVEERDDPSIKGTPAAVVQYKAYKGGGIIAVNYEARAKGVTRNMRGDDAKAVCPEIVLVRVPETRGKADLTKYRDAGREVIQVLTEFSACVERASIDEAYIDLSELVEKRMNDFSSEDLFASWEPKDVISSLRMDHLKTNFVMGCESTEAWIDMIKGSEMAPLDEIKLAVGAEIVGEMREAVYQKTGFRCSAGIAHNKVLAKLVCGINKPNKQTVLPHISVPALWETTKLKKVRNLGGKLGDFFVDQLHCEFMSDLMRFTERELNAHVGSKTGAWIYQLARGYDDEPVNPRQLPKSIGCNKNFFGPEALVTKDKVKFWINQLSAEVVERIQKDYEMNNRRAKTLTLHVLFSDQKALSKSCRVNPQYNAERIATDAYSMMDKLYQNLGVLPVNSLGLIASKFEDEIDTSGYAKINTFFNGGEPKNNAATKPPATATSSSTTSTVTNSTAPIPSTLFSSTNANLPNEQMIPHSSKTVVDNSTVKNVPETVVIEVEGAADATGNNPPTPQKRKPLFVCTVQSDLVTVANRASSSKSPGKPIQPPHNSNSNSPVKQPLAMKQECERCGKVVPLKEYVTHMDRHFAKDLSRELNGLPPLGFDLRPETLEKQEREAAAREREARGSPNKKRGGGPKRPRGRGGLTSLSKRGRPTASSSSTSISQSGRTIDSYFNKQS